MVMYIDMYECCIYTFMYNIALPFFHYFFFILYYVFYYVTHVVGFFHFCTSKSIKNKYNLVAKRDRIIHYYSLYNYHSEETE